jgi:predicted dehydrogenase
VDAVVIAALNRGYYCFRWLRDYSGGQLTNVDVHCIDLRRRYLGKDAPHPVKALDGFKKKVKIVFVSHGSRE